MIAAIAIGAAALLLVLDTFLFLQLCADVRAMRRIAENEHEWFTQDTKKGDRP